MLLLIEGFEGASSQAGGFSAALATLLQSKGHKTSNIRTDDGRLPGVCARSGNSLGLSLNYSTVDDTIIFGFAFKITNIALSTYAARLKDLEDNYHIGVKTTAGGEWEIDIPEGTYTTIGANVANDTWYYIECKIVIGESGSFELRVDTVNVLSETGVDTRANSDGSSNYLVILQNGDNRYYADDLYICDSTTSENNDFLGVCRVVGLFPDGDGSQNDFTPSVGDNYENVDEQDTDDDTTYNTGNSGDIDYYTYASIEHSGIFGIQINTTVRTTDAGNLAVQSKVKSNASVETGEAKYFNVDYFTGSEIVINDPDTAIAWTFGGINNAEFGLEIA